MERLASKGWTECLKLVLEHGRYIKGFNPGARDSIAFRKACEGYHYDTVECLMKEPTIDITACYNEAFLGITGTSGRNIPKANRILRLLLTSDLIDPTY